jgi:imidazolonepropionase-like amidohydrolase
MRTAPLSAVLLFAAALSSPAQSVLIRHARVFDGARMLPPSDVAVREGRISAIGPDLPLPGGATLIDAAGKTLLPGLIDAHVHVTSPDDLKTAIACGVTTCLDMFTIQTMAASLRAEQAATGAPDRTDLLSAGTLATAPGGHGTEYGVPIPTLSTPEEAQAFVDARLAEGSDYIKIVKDDGSAFGFQRPTFDAATLTALVRAAHTRRRLAVVHIATVQDVREALEAGADVITHIPAGPPDPKLARAAAARPVYWCPTLAVIAQGCADLTAVCETNLRWVRELKTAGVSILAGTDAPNPPAAHGAGLHTELEFLVKAGLTPAEALAAATSQPAAAFRLGDRGRIASGLRADLLLVEGDPSVDIRATRNVVSVWKQGVSVNWKPE